jgi:hypothetical protein
MPASDGWLTARRAEDDVGDAVVVELPWTVVSAAMSPAPGPRKTVSNFHRQRQHIGIDALESRRIEKDVTKPN